MINDKKCLNDKIYLSFLVHQIVSDLPIFFIFINNYKLRLILTIYFNNYITITLHGYINLKRE